ncbi:glycylpeptide N-tetradecanoyltransferase [Bimuria novae-zelandiae CBS 107.79]|uniref:Glycylpeptide N-tetradecanoyltransferase n=1 Tax=Bimuria novae-zelandiae CBS 107.79 TaxID=1447943 RepID=A0A6A5UJJ6_9PLEO|nr:glycylpeptide N-tetradecanoyltransferase [Bimuria novae-zelandiae CBS 107.79]
MPQASTKIADADATAEAANEAIAESSKQDAAQVESGDESAEEEVVEGATDATDKKKKKSRKRKIKNALTGTGKGKAPELPASTDAPAGQHLSKEQLNQLLEMNPALKNQLLATKGNQSIEDMLRKLSMNEMLTGLAPQGKNVKDMASHQFWKTQPVPSFDEMLEKDKIVDGPIKEIDQTKVSKEPSEMYPGFKWVTMNLEDEKELDEVYHLLSEHYVEDNEAMFRFRYSPSFLNWALKAPGWKKEWHVGVRAEKSGKLLAFISGIPMRLRVRDRVLNTSEINFLCVHKKLRSKRLAPVLIKEITRRCYVEGVFQAVYTVGSLLPTPVSTCRYYHRAIEWEKLHDVGFSPLPPNSTKQRQMVRYMLPQNTIQPGVRALEPKDTEAVLDLLQRYLKRMDMAQEFNKEEFEHWFFNQKGAKEQVIWAYVVEDPDTKKITDFFSFYNLESTVIGHKKHSLIKAAYLFYYATEKAFSDNKTVLKPRLNELIKDALILAKQADFDVFNALTLLDNPLFLEDQKFGAGDGNLHYYLYNYRAAPLGGGIDANNRPSTRTMGGVGLVML